MRSCGRERGQLLPAGQRGVSLPGLLDRPVLFSGNSFVGDAGRSCSRLGRGEKQQKPSPHLPHLNPRMRLMAGCLSLGVSLEYFRRNVHVGAGVMAR